MSVRSRRRLVGVAGILITAVGLSACTGTWGVRESYRNYITGPIAQGEITTSEGATWLDGPGTGKGPFQWTVDHSSFNPGTETGVVQFKGQVRTVGHETSDGYVLDLTISNPRLDIDGDDGTLVVDLNYRPYAGFDPPVLPAMQAATDIAFANVDLSSVTWTPGPNGNYRIVDAPMEGITSTMELIAWDAFYGDPVALDPLTMTFKPAPPSLASTPSVLVSRTTDLELGDTVTVWGRGFDPAANIGTRPPLAGEPTGVYVVFGKFASTWRPSQGAASNTRTVIAQRWAAPQASRDLVDPTGTNAAFVTLDEFGRFEATLTLGASEVSGNYGVYVYAAGGATNGAHEIAMPTTFTP